MTDADLETLEALVRAALTVSEPEWTYVDGPLVGDVCIETRPRDPGRSRIRLDPNALGPYIAACHPKCVIQLITEVRYLTHKRDALQVKLKMANKDADRLRGELSEAKLALEMSQAERNRLLDDRDATMIAVVNGTAERIAVWLENDGYGMLASRLRKGAWRDK